MAPALFVDRVVLCLELDLPPGPDAGLSRQLERVLHRVLPVGHGLVGGGGAGAELQHALDVARHKVLGGHAAPSHGAWVEGWGCSIQFNLSFLSVQICFCGMLNVGNVCLIFVLAFDTCRKHSAPEHRF